MGSKFNSTSGIYRLNNVYDLPVPVAVRLLRLWVRFPPGAWMFICRDCCVFSGRGLSDELITRPEDPYRVWCVVVCDLKTSRMGMPWPALGRSATDGEKCAWFSFEGGFVGYTL